MLVLSMRTEDVRLTWPAGQALLLAVRGRFFHVVAAKWAFAVPIPARDRVLAIEAHGDTFSINPRGRDKYAFDLPDHVTADRITRIEAHHEPAAPLR